MWIGVDVLGTATMLVWLRSTSWIVNTTVLVLTLVSAFLAVPALDPTRRLRKFRAGRKPVQVGSVPECACIQDRPVRVDLVEACRSGRTVVLVGPDGVGKTQLAAEFASRLRDRGKLDLLVWVTAGSADEIVTAYAQAATTVGATGAGETAPRAATLLTDWLRHSGRRWLIVLDGLDRPADAAGWWPPISTNGRTVATTHSHDPVLGGDGRTVLTVDRFTAGAATNYLTRAVGTLTHLHQADALVADLDRLPLALALAAAFIVNQRLSWGEYHTQLAAHGQHLAVSQPPGDARRGGPAVSIFVPCSLSLEAADAEPPVRAAGRALALAAMLDPNAIPFSVFMVPDVRAYLGILTPDDAGGDAGRADGGAEHLAKTVLAALGNLHRFNLATLNMIERTVRVHPMVQAAVRDLLTGDERDRAARIAADALAAIWPKVESGARSGLVLRANARALRHAAGDALFVPGPHPVLFRAGCSFGEAGLRSAAVEAFDHLCTGCERVLGPDHRQTLATRNDVLHWRGRTGHAADFEEVYRKLYADRLKRLGQDHVQTLTMRTKLALWRSKAGDPAAAAATWKQLVADCVRALGPDHSQTLIVRGNLVRWQGCAGDPAGAVRVGEQLLADRLRLSGPEDPETLDLRDMLAAWRGRAGDPFGAVAACEQVLVDCRRILGPDHPSTLRTRNTLAYWRSKVGNLAGAVTEFEQVLADAVRVLNADHATTLAVRANLGECRGNAGDPAAAVAALEQVLVDRLWAQGPDDPATLNVRGRLAWWQGNAGDPSGAAVATAQLLADRLRTLSPDHPDTLTTRENLAWWLGETGDPAGAVRALEGVLVDRLRVLGPDHPDTLTTRARLAHWKGRAGGPAAPEHAA